MHAGNDALLNYLEVVMRMISANIVNSPLTFSAFFPQHASMIESISGIKAKSLLKADLHFFTIFLIVVSS